MVQYSNHKEFILAYESVGMHVAETILGTTVPEIETNHRLGNKLHWPEQQGPYWLWCWDTFLLYLGSFLWDPFLNGM